MKNRLATEWRDPRFAELDRLIDRDERRQKLAVDRKKRTDRAPHKSRIAEHAVKMRKDKTNPRDRALALFFHRYAISPTRICEAVAAETDVSVSAIRGKNHDDVSVQARQLAFWLMRQLTPASLPQIGAFFNGRHHTTVLHGITAVDGRREIWSQWREITEKLLAEFGKEEEAKDA